MRIGLTGGIGSGKSAVAEVFADRGALVVDTDRLAREAVAPGTPGLARIRARWPGVVGSDGALDRAALGAVVFGDEGERRALNAIVHPEVRRLGAQREAAAEPGRLVVFAVPLLFEEGFAARCDRTVVVIAPLAARLARLRARDGLDDAAIRARMAAQIDPEEARRRADVVVENDATLAALRIRAAAVYDRLAAEARRTTP